MSACGKVIYADVREAMVAAQSLRERLGSAKQYFCDDCQAYHLTTNTVRKRYKIKRKGK